MYEIYTDGSFKNSIGAGGYATIILKDGKIIKQLYQGFKNTTNNRMEILGVLEALRYFKEPTDITIYSDSQYVISSLQHGWVKKWFEEKDFTKKNLDLWFEALDLYEYHNVKFVWVKGHANNTYNELADTLAQHAAECLNLPEDVQRVNFQEDM